MPTHSFGLIYRPFLHYAPVSKHKEMRTRLGWTVSHKSLYFTPPEPRVGAFVYRNAGNVYNVSEIKNRGF